MADAKRDNNQVTTLLAVSNVDGITPVVLWADPTTHRLLVSATLAMTVGSTTVSGGVSGRVLYDNAGVLGEYTISGSGSVAMTTSPTFVTPTLGVASATSLATSAASPLLLTNGQLVTVALTAQTVGATTLTIPNFASVSDTFVFSTLAQTLANKTLTTPVINGTATGTGVSSTPTANILAMWDANKNLSANNFIDGFTTTATAAGTTILTIASTGIQVFTGASTQTVLLPTTGVVAGGQYIIVNNSSGAVTVQSSGANTITVLAANTSAIFTAVVATPTTAANWNSQYVGIVITSGKSLSASATLTLAGTDGKTLTVSNSLTLAGTDATTMTFPTTSATIARTDAGQTFTGTQVMTSPKILTSILDTNGNTELSMIATASAVNYVEITNAATGTTGAKIAAQGETNIDLQIAAKGTGGIHQKSGNYQDIQTYTPAAAGTATLDLSLSNIHHITMPAGNITIALSNAKAGQCFIVRILQDSVGSRTVTWFTTITWAGAAAPTLTTTASRADTFGFEAKTTTTFDGFIVGQNIG